MIDINYYDFSKKPFDEGEKFNVFPLSDEGVNQYYSKDAHTHTFLDQLNPRKMEQIYKEKNELDSYMQQVLETRQSSRQAFLNKINGNTPSNALHEDYKTNRVAYGLNDQEGNKQGIDNNIPYENQDAPYRDPNNARSQTIDKSSKQGTLKNRSNSYNDKTLLNRVKRHEFSTSKFQQQPLDEKLACFGKTTYGKLAHPKLLKSQFFEKPKTRYSMNESHTQPYIPKYVTRSTQKTGFESYNIPRVVPANKLKPIQVSQFDNRCFKSLSGFFDSNQTDIHAYLEKENERLGNILLNQTSEGFLRSNRLPKISFIVNQPDIIVKKTKIGNSKFLGNQYNPFNYNPANSKNLTKRNIYGSLFQH